MVYTGAILLCVPRKLLLRSLVSYLVTSHYLKGILEPKNQPKAEKIKKSGHILPDYLQTNIHQYQSSLFHHDI